MRGELLRLDFWLDLRAGRIVGQEYEATYRKNGDADGTYFGIDMKQWQEMIGISGQSFYLVA